MQITGKRSPKRMWITGQASPLFQPPEHGYYPPSIKVPDILTTTILRYILPEQLSSSLRERCFPFFTAFPPNLYKMVSPIYI